MAVNNPPPQSVTDEQLPPQNQPENHVMLKK